MDPDMDLAHFARLIHQAAPTSLELIVVPISIERCCSSQAKPIDDVLETLHIVRNAGEISIRGGARDDIPPSLFGMFNWPARVDIDALRTPSDMPSLILQPQMTILVTGNSQVEFPFMMFSSFSNTQKLSNTSTNSSLKWLDNLTSSILFVMKMKIITVQSVSILTCITK